MTTQVQPRGRHRAWRLRERCRSKGLLQLHYRFSSSRFSRPQESYDTKDFKPETVTDQKAGAEYELVPAGNYTAGTAGKDNNLTKSDKTDLVDAPDPTGGEPAGKIEKPLTEITYVYKAVKGDVVVCYVDNEGNPLDGSEAKFKDDDSKNFTIGTVKAEDTVFYNADYPAATFDTKATNVGTAYDTEDKWPITIEKDGKTYERVPALTQGSTSGKVVAGTTVVTYVNKLKETPAKTGNVVVHYVNTDGKEIATKVYDTTDYKPTVIEEKQDDNTTKPYKLVPAGDYKVGTVNDKSTLTAGVENGPDFTKNPAAETGKVIDGTLDATYVYEEVKGDVVVKYQDTDGNPLPGTGSYTGSDKKLTIGELTADKTVDPDDEDYVAAVQNTPASSVGTAYDTTANKPNRITTADGRVYELVPAGEYTVGEVDKNGHLTTSAPVTGKVKEDPQTVTYVYREVKGDVIVHYVKQGVQMRGFRAT